MLAAFASAASGSSHSTSSGGNFGGGTLGGINFGQYKSTDQNTILLVGVIVLVAIIVMGKQSK